MAQSEAGALMADLLQRGPTGSVARLVWRLGHYGVLCDNETADGVRAAILDAGVQFVTYGRGNTRTALSFAERFEEVFQQPLVPKARRASRG